MTDKCCTGKTAKAEQLDIGETAAASIQKYGREAALIAWGIADGHACDGDIDAYQAWARVLIAIKQTSDEECPQEGRAVAGGLEAGTRSA